MQCLEDGFRFSNVYSSKVCFQNGTFIKIFAELQRFAPSKEILFSLIVLALFVSSTTTVDFSSSSNSSFDHKLNGCNAVYITDVSFFFRHCTKSCRFGISI